jgi:hypothetical protein
VLCFILLTNPTKALAVIGIQIQLLTSASITISATARAILCLGITFELLGLILIISFPTHSSETLPLIFSLVPRMYTIPVLLGILGLAVTVMLEAVDASLGAAIFMGCILALSGMSCLLALWLRAYGRM